jgi:hypothetical protein
MALTEQIQSILSQIFVLPRRFSLVTPGVRATVPMLRGVWGAALHDLDSEAYCKVFLGEGNTSERVPAFVLRPVPPPAQDLPALDWIVIGHGLEYDTALLRAWDIASGMGLGRERHSFHIRTCQPLGPDGEPAKESSGWSLLEAAWSIKGPPHSTPCRLRFPTPLRLLRDHRLIEQPTAIDIALAAIRRISAFAPSLAREALERIKPAVIEQARTIRAEIWQGRRLDLVRYSGRQKRELEMRGVSGHLDLPEGPGHLWPLLAAAQWLHLGKGTVVGMGQIVLEPVR